jgi:hypothetical protein
MAIIGLDIHRSFAQAASLRDGQIIREQRVELVRDRLIKFAKSLSIEDESSSRPLATARPSSGSCGPSSSG